MRLRLDQLPAALRRRVEAELARSGAPGPAAQTAPASSAASRPHPRGRVCSEDGIRFGSATELRVYRRLRGELAAAAEPDVRLFCHVKFPLWNLAPHPNGRPRTLEVDFAIVRGTRLVRVIDAKPTEKSARSRDWARGAAAFAACYSPLAIEECSA